MPVRAFHRVAGLVRRVVEPVDSVRSAAERRTGRLIATLLLGLSCLPGIALVGYAVAPGRFVAGIEALAIAGVTPAVALGYLLARQGRWRAATWVLITGMSLMTFFLQIAALRGMNPLYQAKDAAALCFIALPVLLAGSILSRRETLWLTLAEVAAMLSVPLAAPFVRYDQLIAGPVALVVLLAILVVIVSAHRDRLEVERSVALRVEIEERSRAQADLARYRDELEVMIRERTRRLETANRELIEASEAKSRFLANVSHELRTPLNSIIGFTGVVRQGLAGPLTEEQERQLGMASRSAGQLLQLINQLLDLSRIESGAVVLEHEPFDVAELLAEVRDAVGPLAGSKDLVIVSGGVDLPGGNRIVSDRGKLRQILLNLAGNAVKFTAAGRVTLSCTALGDLIVFSVEDTGIGIPAEELDAVFDEYRQIDGVDGSKPQGTGLGLAVSQKLARLLGGEITAESTVGAGSRFSMRLTRRAD